MNTLKKLKDETRKIFLEKRASMDPSLKKARDKKVCSCALSLASYRYADCVLMYAALDDEIDIMPVAEDALKKGKKVAFPRCNREEHTMDFHFVTSLEELKVDSYGIREPSADLPVFNASEHNGGVICFVPGLIYDKKGYRLGYGKGFYDRYLSGLQGNIIGVVYSDFIVPTVPIGKYDVSLNILLTEKGVVVTGEN